MTRSLCLFMLACCTVACAAARPSPVPAPSLAGEADALYTAAAVHALPERDGYDPERAAALLQQFLDRFPNDRRGTDARERLALLNEIVVLRAELRAIKAIDLQRPPYE